MDSTKITTCPKAIWEPYGDSQLTNRSSARRLAGGGGGHDSGERGRNLRIGFGAMGIKRKGEIRGGELDKGQDGRSKGEAGVKNCPRSLI